jgi:hypothetical protein
MPVAARRVFRLSLTVSLSLACGYGLAMPLPFLAPVFALMLTATPGPPMGLRSLLGLFVVIAVTLGVGLLLIPLLTRYPLSGLLLVAVGLFFSFYLTVNLGKGLVGTLLTVGITLISAAGTVSSALAVAVIYALLIGIGVAILCQWVAYSLFTEPLGDKDAEQATAATPVPDRWIALRATLIVLPPYLLALTNPSLYLPLIMKSVSLGQQGSEVTARSAGRELLGSTFLAGCCAILFWFALKIAPTLWLFFLWMLLFGIYFSAKLYQLIPTRHPASFWLNVATTMLILLGPAVEDSANGRDPYAAFAVRMGLFIAVTLYAWTAIALLERLRESRLRERISDTASMEYS